MCCFSQKAEVKNTRIFARRSGPDQFLVYQMGYHAAQDLALVLPIPTPPGSPEDAVTFLDLSGYDDFFSDLEEGFPSRTLGMTTRGGDMGAKSILKVVQVGDFEASFVPTPDDFSRLDPQFRINPDLWNRIPTYRDYGFVVAKLKATSSKPHPIGFRFPMRDQNPSIFIPTVHIHDGIVHDQARFDHQILVQRGTLPSPRWEGSPRLAGQFCQVEKTHGAVDPGSPVYRTILFGNHPNQDLWV